MAVTTSSQFASSTHGGGDWREVSKKVLEDLQSVQTDEYKPNLGFLYVSDHLAKDIVSILNLFRSVLGIELWVGTIGIGVCGNGKARIDQPAISAMIGRFDEEDFCILPNEHQSPESFDHFNFWLQNNDPMLVLTHAHPANHRQLQDNLRVLEEKTGGFLVGGISLCRPDFAVPIESDPSVNMQGGTDAVTFSDRVKVAVSLSQGCDPIGEIHTITKSHEHVVRELDSQIPQEIFEQDLRAMAIKKLGQDPDQIMVQEGDEIPEEFRNVFGGEILAAFPISESDTGDVMVRQIMGVDESGALTIGHNVVDGERMMFVRRNNETLKSDLSRKLVELRERVEKDHGQFAPKGGVYISCSARAFDENGHANESEVELIKEILGEFPLCGFYAGGEIKGASLYGYTGILTLFL